MAQNVLEGQTMTSYRGLLSVCLAFGLSACGSYDLASRNQATTGPAMSFAAQDGVQRIILSPQYNVTTIKISVPQTLKVSEANMFYPIADIVWRGEPRGDRYAQVKAIFTEAFGLGTSRMKSGPKVVVEAEVTRFHALTEKTRYTVGGMHSLKFILTVRSAETGQIIDGPRQVTADVRAAGGSQAIAEDQAGRTQRVVIIEQLRSVIRRELSRKEPDLSVSRSDYPVVGSSASASAL